MTAPARQLHLGAAIDGLGHHPAAWRLAPISPAQVFTAGPYVAHAQLAERGLLDLVTLDDTFVQTSDRTDQIPARLDALLTMARIAPRTERIGLIPTVDTTHTEPFNVSKNVATLDWVSRGRAGWAPAVARTEEDYRLFGRRAPASAEALYEEAADVIDVGARLWDSWEDDAIIRDKATGRYIDRNKLHYVDFEGKYFSVRGPSITPRSPQAHPLIAVQISETPAEGETTPEDTTPEDTTPEDTTPEDTTPEDLATTLAANWADVVIIDAADLDTAIRKRREIRRLAAHVGRNCDEVFVLANVEGILGADDDEASTAQQQLDALTPWPARPGRLRFVGASAGLATLMTEWFAAEAVDGFLLRPACLPNDLQHLVDGVVPRLQQAGIFRSSYTGTTLRDLFGLSRPANRYAGIA